MIYGIGTDIADVRRIADAYARHGGSFAAEILSPNELPLLEKRTDKAEFLAGRWAAKEAFSKALHTGMGAKCSFREIEILNAESGVPRVSALYGNTRNTVDGLGITQIHLSISHERNAAVAFVVLEL